MNNLTLPYTKKDIEEVMGSISIDSENFFKLKLISRKPDLKIKGNSIEISKILNKDLNFWRGFLAGTRYSQN